MAKRRSKKRKKTSRTTAGLQFLRDVDWTRARSAGVAAGWIALLGFVSWGWAEGVPELRVYARSASDATSVGLRFVEPPAWLNGELQEELVRTGLDQLGADPMDRLSLEHAREALMQTGWFDEVAQVRRVRADLVEVDARFVQPYAVVRDGAGDHLVDPAGRLLPRSVPIGHAPRFTVIEGARYPRPRRVGSLWEGADVTAALRLKRTIAERAWSEQVSAIDVSRYHEQQVLFLVTKWQQRIRWGRAAGDERSGEVTTERKLAYIDHLDKHYGRIDGGHVGEVDITNPQGVFGR